MDNGEARIDRNMAITVEIGKHLKRVWIIAMWSMHKDKWIWDEFQI